MKCPNCAKVNVINNVCPACGVDSVLFQQTAVISCNLYNKGLAQAKLRDLTGAIALLTKSIEFNKNNIMARNLLGLVYFEVGYVGDAIKHWVISTSQMRENNEATAYIDRLQANSRRLEQMGDAVKMYNNALEYLKQKADDMAIIQLKKALEINPAFVDALNLLAFCYLIQKDKPRAASLVEKVLSLDINNPIAMRYYKELHPAKIRPESKRAAKMPPGGASHSAKVADQRSKRMFGESFHLAEILSFLIGTIVSFALFWILVLPGAVTASHAELSSLRQSLTEVEQRLAEESAANTERNDMQELLIRQLTHENDELSAQATLRQRIEIVVNATAHRDAGEMSEAAMLLRSLGDDLSGLTEEFQSVANALINEVYPQAARQFWQLAIAEYDSGNYAEALEQLDLSISFGAANEPHFYPSVLFHRGSIAERNGNYNLAARYYQSVIAEFPHSAYVQRARARLQNLP